MTMTKRRIIDDLEHKIRVNKAEIDFAKIAIQNKIGDIKKLEIEVNECQQMISEMLPVSVEKSL